MTGILAFVRVRRAVLPPGLGVAALVPSAANAAPPHTITDLGTFRLDARQHWLRDRQRRGDRRRILRRLHVVLAVATIAFTCSVLPTMARAAGSVYVANFGGTVSQYSIDPASGALSPKSPATLPDPAGPQYVAVSSDGTSVYVTNQTGQFPPIDGSVSQFSIDPTTGALSPKTPATVPTGLFPSVIAGAPDGSSAYVVNRFGDVFPGPGTVSQYSIDTATGALSPDTPPTVDTGSFSPTAVAVTPNSKSAYVTNLQSATVAQYNIDPLTGALTPKTPATVAAGSFPGDIAVTPDGKSAYVTDGSGSGTVLQFNIDPVTGALSPKTPATVDAGSFPADIAVSPDGKSVYVGYGNNPGISQYDVDPATGALSPKTPATVDAGGSFDIAPNPDGKSVYVTNNGAGTISQYDVDPVTGALSPKTPATVATGGAPIGIAVTPLQAPTSKNQCMNGGWQNFGSTFKNQGDCVSFVASGGKNQPTR